MAALELALVLLATVLVSSVIAQLISRISLPLIQVACGVVVALLANTQVAITLNPELFLVLFIAPLLFHEARESNKMQLWKNRGAMLSYAIGLVVAIVLIVGFSLHWLAPSIPLAAAFALGAALGPTDPIAVASVAQRADIPRRQDTILQGESLLNDASGIVSFQFAVAAVVTGTFSAVEAVEEFAVSFVGALVFGCLLGYILVKVTELVRNWGLENTTFHVLLEILTPFIAYLLGEAVHVSGIIMVVACGITMSLAPQAIKPSVSRLNIVSSSVWEVITFALNGVVFVILGTQLPQSIGNIWANTSISNTDLILIIVIVTVLMHGTRFVWTLVSEAYTFRREGEQPTLKERLRSALTMTLAGSKGAITLAIMFSIPLYVNNGTSIQAFPQRDLLIFIASGVILLSLLVATFLVPLLAPREKPSEEKQERARQAQRDILRAVIVELTAEQTPDNAEAMRPVIEQYTERLEQLSDDADSQDDAMKQLRLQVLDWEQEYVLDLIENDEVEPLDGYMVVNHLARLSSFVKRDAPVRARFAAWTRRFFIILRKLWRGLRGKKAEKKRRETGVGSRPQRAIIMRTYEYIIERLRDEMTSMDFPSEVVSKLISEYQATLHNLRNTTSLIRSIADRAELDREAARLGLSIEREKIQEAYDDGRISRTQAQRMRENVYLMQADLEDYM